MKDTHRGPRRAVRGGAPSEGGEAAGAGLQTRRVALEILCRVDADRAFADVMLGHRLGELANPADRRLLTLLVLGTIAWQGRLDYELAQLSSRPLDELDPEVRALLRLGLYQLRRLARVPAHAAVDTAVRLARELRGGAGVSGFVNAVLRAATRHAVDLPPRVATPGESATRVIEESEITHLAVAYSHPRWLVERFVQWFGVATAEALMAADNEAAPNAIRLNLARGSAAEMLERVRGDGMEVASRGLLPETILLRGAISFDSASYRDGCFTVQAEASQIVAHLLAPPPGATVVDCAAAPGGKSAHLAAIVGTKGQVIALDLNLAGLKQARSVAARLGHRNIQFARCDTAAALPLRRHAFHYVLLDAPCTGLGTLREHPEIRWRLRPDDFARMAEVQARMLENAAALVATGGVIVYAVCSFAPAEGEMVVSGFLTRHPEFGIDADAIRREPLAELIDADGFMRTRPDCGARDGFFAARLKKHV
ncbi:MAG: 16S rRNA (cytosine(967)-C(5))-methyltransferase RsmB [Candidatus Binataceae bacterium]